MQSRATRQAHFGLAFTAVREILTRFTAMLDTSSSRRKPETSDLKDPQKSLDPGFRRGDESVMLY